MKTKATTTKAKGRASVKRLQQRCAELQEEVDRLRKKLALIREDRSHLIRALGGPILDEWAKEEIDEEAILAQIAKGQSQSLEEMIAEVEAEVSKQCQPRKRRRTK
jgi:hypothetical protein